MTAQLTPIQKQRRAVLTRARAEATILRADFLSDILPVVEAEFDRRVASGELTNLAIPTADTLAALFIDEFFRANAPVLTASTEA